MDEYFEYFLLKLMFFVVESFLFPCFLKSFILILITYYQYILSLHIIYQYSYQTDISTIIIFLSINFLLIFIRCKITFNDQLSRPNHSVFEPEFTSVLRVKTPDKHFLTKVTCNTSPLNCPVQRKTAAWSTHSTEVGAHELATRANEFHLHISRFLLASSLPFSLSLPLLLFLCVLRLDMFLFYASFFSLCLSSFLPFFLFLLVSCLYLSSFSLSLSPSLFLCTLSTYSLNLHSPLSFLPFFSLSPRTVLTYSFLLPFFVSCLLFSLLFLRVPR